MENKPHHMIPIWFFIGINLLVYGVVILGTGILEWNNPPATVEMTHVHAPVWWGMILLVIGLFYTVRFRPSAHSGLDEPPADHIAEKGTKWD
jgi:FtsH-binding integral membrane protein